MAFLDLVTIEVSRFLHISIASLVWSTLSIKPHSHAILLRRRCKQLSTIDLPYLPTRGQILLFSTSLLHDVIPCSLPSPSTSPNATN